MNRSVIKADEGCGCKSGIGAILASEGVTLMLAGNIGGEQHAGCDSHPH